MKRALLGVVVVAILVGTPLVATNAFAGPTPKTTVTLVCDRNANASVTFTLTKDLFGSEVLGSQTMDCGPDSVNGLTRNRQVFTTNGNAGAVRIDYWTKSDGGCSGAGVLAYKDTCLNDSGIGSQLTVR